MSRWIIYLIFSKNYLKSFQFNPIFGPSKEPIHHTRFYEVHSRNDANTTTKSIKCTCNDGVEHEITCRRWISHFRKGNVNLKDKLKEGHPRGLDSDDLETAVEANLIITVREFRKHFKVSHMIVHHEMKIFGKVSRIGKWITHDLVTENHK